MKALLAVLVAGSPLVENCATLAARPETERAELCLSLSIRPDHCAFLDEVLALHHGEAAPACKAVADAFECAHILGGALSSPAAQALVETDCLHTFDAEYCSVLRKHAGMHERSLPVDTLWECHAIHSAEPRSATTPAPGPTKPTPVPVKPVVPVPAAASTPAPFDEADVEAHSLVVPASLAMLGMAGAGVAYYRSRPRVVALVDTNLLPAAYSNMPEPYDPMA